ncbi:hypothetical protein [Streptomyces sp. NBC_01601]|uniref:hypothetical protein n=1 Tax=Streptomyces sp. NBC_01601 TaxID=2975892 RepID=UPI002E2C5F09|nr:hypothetical protein [Streptomyces sp. NBC_01601]
MSEQPFTIDPHAIYAEHIAFLDGTQGRTRPFLGSAVRERIGSMTYTDAGEERTYGTVAQDPETLVITGTSTTSPDPRGHHTATWTRIPDDQFKVLLEEDARRWAQVCKAAASVGLAGTA